MSNVVSWLNEPVEDRPSAWTHERPKKTDREIREENKRFRTIYEEEGLTYGDDVKEEELPDRYRVAMRIREKNVDEVFKSIRLARNVELCFLVDVTGSMQPHIDEVRNSINKIVDALKTPTTASAQHTIAKKLRISFVAYRDIGDTKQFETFPFSDSVANFRSFCSTLVADGGADGPEDVFGGIEKALELLWSPNFGTKVIFHIADAPCHGTKFHDMHDHYPLGDPKKRTETYLFKRMLDNGIDYHFGKINNSTDKMIKIFSEVYESDIIQFDIKNVKAITDAVVTAVSHSVSAAISKSTMPASTHTKRSYTLVKEIPNWSTISQKEGRFLNYEFPQSIEDIINDVPLPRKTPKRAIVKVAEKPFANGAERYAFYGCDITYGTIEEIVLKEYLHTGRGMNSATRYETTNQIQTIASFLAHEFSQALSAACKKDYTIKFLKIKTLSLEVSEKKFRYMSCEKLFKKNSEFIRFTNNTDYGMLEETAQKMGIDVNFVKALMAFSHWTYQKSNKTFMVVDLQGVIDHEPSGRRSTILLTDPAIHCTNKTRFGRMNHGKEGMNSFFTRHQCNDFCKALGLNPVRAEVEE